jgi:hypothetical protein
VNLLSRIKLPLTVGFTLDSILTSQRVKRIQKGEENGSWNPSLGKVIAGIGCGKPGNKVLTTARVKKQGMHVKLAGKHFTELTSLFG